MVAGMEGAMPVCWMGVMMIVMLVVMMGVMSGVLRKRRREEAAAKQELGGW